MTTTTVAGSRLGGLDGLRGLAAVAVLICHIAGYWTFMALPGKLPELMTLGAQGVDVFIAISGFVLFLPVLRARGTLNARVFFGRRAMRILPAYYVALTLASMLAMLPHTWSRVVAEQADPSDVIFHVLGVQTWFPAVIGAINGSLWSVSLELHLYVCFPLLVLLWRRWGVLPLVLASVLLAVGWDLLGQLETSRPWGVGLGDEHALPARLPQFVLGMWCAERLLRAGAPPLPRAALTTGAFALLAALATTTEQRVPVKVLLWGGFGVALVLLTVAIGQRFASSATVSTLDTFGERAYSFYLLHQPILLLLALPVSKLPGWPTQLIGGGLVALLLVTVAAELLYRSVELPTHQLGRRIFRNPTLSR